MAKRNRAEAALPSSGPSRPKRPRGQELSPEVDISSDHVHSEAEDDGERRAKEELKQQGLKIWQAVKDATSIDGRIMSALFMVPPDKKLYPDYYRIIQRPIALNEIKHKLAVHIYNTLDELKADFDLCFDNAQTYNHESSLIFADARDMQKLVGKLYQEIVSSEETKHKKHKSPSLRRTLKYTLQKLVALTDDSGRIISDLFMALPSRTEWAMYYDQIANPQCFDNIFKRIKRKEYTSAQDFADDVELVFSNCMQFNQDHTPIWEDAVSLQKHFRQLMSELPPPFSVERYSRPSGPKIKIKMPVASTSHIPPAKATARPQTPPPAPAPKVVAAPAQAASATTVKSSPTSTSTGKTKAAALKPPAPKPAVVSKPSAPAPAPKVIAAKAVEPKVLRSSVTTKPPPAAVPLPPTPAPTLPAINGHKAVYGAVVAPHPAAPLLPTTAPFSQYSTPAHTPGATIAPLPAPAPAAPSTRSQVAALAQTQAKPVRQSPAAPPAHQLEYIHMRSMPRGRPFLLHHRDGVKSWSIRFGPEEQSLSISDITFLHDDDEDSSGDEDDMETDVEPVAKPKRGRGRPPKPKTGAAKVKVRTSKKKTKFGEIQVKLNGMPKEAEEKGKDTWCIPMPVGSSTVEVGEQGGLIWKIYVYRIAQG